jgi:hypothetical protein
MVQFGPALSIAVLFTTSYLCPESSQGPRVNPDARIVQDFERRVQEYVKLDRQAQAQGALPALKPTDNAEKIHEDEQGLARAIRVTRSRAQQGDIFTPEVSREFKRLIGIAYQASEAHRIRVSLKSGDPVNLRLQVNQTYPENMPLQTTPPTVLLNLPRLPPELEYRLVGRSLVLRDVKANVVVDFIPNAIP